MKIGELSGSLTNLLDGTSYLIAGTNVTIVSESNGAVTISSTGGGGPVGDQFFFSTTSGSIYSSGSLALIGGGDEWGIINSPADKGTDVFFYVSGSIGSKDSADPGVSMFGGDVVVSGSFFSEGDIIEMTGSLTVTGGISGSLTNLPDGTSYLIAGDNISIVSQSNGSILISNTFAQVDDYFDSSTPGSIFTSGSTAFVGVGEFGVVDSPSDKGTDVFFYVSGSIGSKESTALGTSLFGGDVVISGSLYTEGDRFEMSGTLFVTQGISGSLTKLTDGTSYLIAGNNIGIISQSNGSIIISSSTPTLVYRPGGVETDNVYSSWDSLMSALNQLEGVVTVDVDTSITSPATVSVGTHDFESRVILRGTQTGFVNPSRLQMPDGAVIKNPREFENIWLDMLATTSPNFDIDVDDRSIKFSGVSYIEMNGTQPFADITAALTLGVAFQFRDSVIINNYSPSNRCFLSINNASANVTLILIDNVIINNDNFIAGTAGTLYVYHDSSIGTNFLIALPANPNFAGTTTLSPLDNAKLVAYDDLFAGATELSASTVQVAIDVLKERWSSAIGNNLFTTSSIAIKGDESGIDTASDKGTDVFFYVSGSISGSGAEDKKALFGGDVRISGSLTVGTGSITITSNDIQFGSPAIKIENNGNQLKLFDSNFPSGLLLSDLAGGGGDSFFASTAAGSIFTTGSAAFRGGESAVDSPVDKGSDVFFYVSGSIAGSGVEDKKSLFGGDVVISGSLFSQGDRLEMSGTMLVTEGISGSLTKLTDGTSYLIAGSNVTITSQSNGSVVIAAATQAPTDASYLVLGANVTLTTERTFTPGTGLLGTDGGANGSYTLAINNNVVATLTGSTFSGVTLHNAGLSGSLTKLTDGTSYLIAGSNISITTGSNGAVTISNTFVQVDDYFDSTTAGSIFTTGSTAFRGTESSVDSPADKGTDVFFYVSGSIAGSGDENRRSLFGGDVVVSGSIDVKNNVILGDVTTDTVTFNGRVASSVLPSVDNVYDLGSATNRWANVYTGDLHLRNDRGDWTLIEEEEFLTIRNNKTGRMFRLVMEPLDPQE